MAARLSRKHLPRYSLDFRLSAVKMLSRWRQEAREGRLRGVASQSKLERSSGTPTDTRTGGTP
jgi:hypothetical protein